METSELYDLVSEWVSEWVLQLLLFLLPSEVFL